MWFLTVTLIVMRVFFKDRSDYGIWILSKKLIGKPSIRILHNFFIFQVRSQETIFVELSGSIKYAKTWSVIQFLSSCHQNSTLSEPSFYLLAAACHNKFLWSISIKFSYWSFKGSAYNERLYLRAFREQGVGNRTNPINQHNFFM